MKYLILMYGSQQDYDAMAGNAGPGEPAWSAADFILLFLCCHPALSPASQTALTLRGRRSDHRGGRPGLPGARGDHDPADHPGPRCRSRTAGSRS
jgi:hypothetical protein